MSTGSLINSSDIEEKVTFIKTAEERMRSTHKMYLFGPEISTQGDIAEADVFAVTWT